MIPPLRRVFSQKEKHQSKQSSSSPFSENPFTEVLEDACKKEQQRDIHIVNSGYTKNALPFYNLVSMREYC